MSKRLNDSHIGYMETSPAPFIEYETEHGETHYLPKDLFDIPLEDVTPESLNEFIFPGSTIEKVKVTVVREGILWRMTAPGYLDSTDWSPAENEEEAEREAREVYCDEEEEEEE